MDRISLKAFIVGNVLSFVLMFGLLLVLAIVLLLARPAGMDLHLYKQSLASSSGAVAAETVVCIFALLVAGYVAARMAGHDLLLNAALAATGLMITNVWTLMRPHQNPFDHPILTVASWGAPLITLAGGWLAGRRTA